MPYVSDEAIEEMKGRVGKIRAKLREKGTVSGVKGRKNVLMMVGEAAGAAGVMGYLRGREEAAGRHFTFMEMDIELLVGAALVGVPVSGLVKKLPVPGQDLVNAGMGVLAHYTGQLARKFATLKPGDKMSYVAGDQFIGNGSHFSLPHRQQGGYGGYAVGADEANDRLFNATTF